MSHSVAVANTGAHIFLVGLVLQTVSYVVFLFMVLRAHNSIKRSKESTGREPWWKIIRLIYFSSVFILVSLLFAFVNYLSNIVQGPMYLPDNRRYWFLPIPFHH